MDRKLTMLYLYIDDRLTLDEIGKAYNITRERVRQLISSFPEYQVRRECRKKMNRAYSEIAKTLSPYEKNERVTKRFWNHVEKRGENECWEWLGVKHLMSGYGRYHSGMLGRVYNESSTHRLMWCITRGKQVPKGRFICHTCDNPSCVNPEHLYLGDAQSNVNDRESRSDYKSFVRKLSNDDVTNIRHIYNQEGMPCLENLADAYGVTETYLYILVKNSDIRNGGTGDPPRGEAHYKSKLTELNVLEMRQLYKTGEHTYKELGKMFGVYWVTAYRAVKGDTWKHVES